LSREDHRKHDAALELLREQQKTIMAQHEGISSGDIALWFLAACMALGLFLAAPKLGRDVTLIVLVAMLGCLAHPIWQLPVVKNAKSVPGKSLWFMGSMAFSAALITGFAVYVWPPLRRHTVSEKERLRFEEPLRKQDSPRDTIRLMCPQADENTCAYAGQFIALFGEAGWTVIGNQVERGTFSRPMSGVVLIRPRAGGELDPSKWNSGLWAAVTPSVENIRRAFVNIEIEPDSVVEIDSRFPNGIMGIYFGPEKENAAEETPLTKTMKQIEESRRKQRRP
jgi:hypothetical protein